MTRQELASRTNALEVEYATKEYERKMEEKSNRELVITDLTDQVQKLKNALELMEQENETLKEKTRRMKFMIDNGLGWEDIINHTRLYGRDTN